MGASCNPPRIGSISKPPIKSKMRNAVKLLFLNSTGGVNTTDLNIVKEIRIDTISNTLSNTIGDAPADASASLGVVKYLIKVVSILNPQDLKISRSMICITAKKIIIEPVYPLIKFNKGNL
jgi:hypothetical protein